MSILDQAGQGCTGACYVLYFFVHSHKVYVWMDDYTSIIWTFWNQRQEDYELQVGLSNTVRLCLNKNKNEDKTSTGWSVLFKVASPQEGGSSWSQGVSVSRAQKNLSPSYSQDSCCQGLCICTLKIAARPNIVSSCVQNSKLRLATVTTEAAESSKQAVLLPDLPNFLLNRNFYI